MIDCYYLSTYLVHYSYNYAIIVFLWKKDVKT